MSTPDHPAESPRPSATLSAGARGIPATLLNPRDAADVLALTGTVRLTDAQALNMAASLTRAGYELVPLGALAVAYGCGRDDEAAGNDIPQEYR